MRAGLISLLSVSLALELPWEASNVNEGLIATVGVDGMPRALVYPFGQPC